MAAGPLFQDDLVSNIMEALVRFEWLRLKGAFWVLVSAVRHPLITATALTAWALAHWGGPPAILSTAGLLTVALVAWRFAWPASFTAQVGLRWAGAWRGALVYRPFWRHVAARHGLVAYSPVRGQDGVMDREVAGLGKVRVATGIHRCRSNSPLASSPRMWSGPVRASPTPSEPESAAW